MKTNEQKEQCSLIQDLLPLYSENLCTEETAECIRTHLEACEECRKLASALPTDTDLQEAPPPDEANAMRKIRRKMKKSKHKLIIVTALFILLFVPVAVLTVGSIFNTQLCNNQIFYFPTFESVGFWFKSQIITRQLLDNDWDAMLEKWDFTEDFSMHAAKYLTGVSEKLEDEYAYECAETVDARNLQALYDAAYGDTKVKDIDVVTGYPLLYVSSDVTVTFEDGRILNITINSRDSGEYVCNGFVGEDASEAEKNFAKYLSFMSDHGNSKPTWIEAVFKNKKTEDPEKAAAFYENSIRHAEDLLNIHDGSVGEKMWAFYDSGYRISDVRIAPIYYDEKKKTLYYEMVLVAEDGQGTAYLLTRLDYDYQGLKRTEERHVFGEGCTQGLIDALENYVI